MVDEASISTWLSESLDHDEPEPLIGGLCAVAVIDR